MVIAMPIDPQDLERFKRHIERFTSQAGCSVCGKADWKVSGPFAYLALKEAKGEGLSVVLAEGLPVIVAVCATCGFLRQFAWESVFEGGRRDG